MYIEAIEVNGEPYKSIKCLSSETIDLDNYDGYLCGHEEVKFYLSNGKVVKLNHYFDVWKWLKDHPDISNICVDGDVCCLKLYRQKSMAYMEEMGYTGHEPCICKFFTMIWSKESGITTKCVLNSIIDNISNRLENPLVVRGARWLLPNMKVYNGYYQKVLFLNERDPKRISKLFKERVFVL